jgi:hypothetical protein
VTLWADGRVEYEAFVLDGPDRLVVDLPGVINRLERYSYNVDQDGLARVRAAQHQTTPIPVTRVVFDLHAPLAYEISESEGGLEIRFGEAAQSDWPNRSKRPNRSRRKRSSKPNRSRSNGSSPSLSNRPWWPPKNRR